MLKIFRNVIVMFYVLVLSFSDNGTLLTIPEFYLQLIVWAPTRERAIQRMKRALNDTIITGKGGRIQQLSCPDILLQLHFCFIGIFS